PVSRMPPAAGQTAVHPLLTLLFSVRKALTLKTPRCPWAGIVNLQAHGRRDFRWCRRRECPQQRPYVMGGLSEMLASCIRAGTSATLSAPWPPVAGSFCSSFRIVRVLPEEERPGAGQTPGQRNTRGGWRSRPGGGGA